MKYLLVLQFILFAFSSSAQKKRANIYSISYGHGNGQIKPFAAKAEMNGINSKGPVNIMGLNYYIGIGKSTYLETGVSFLTHKYTFTKFDYPRAQPPINQTYNAFSVPLKLRFDIAKYFFISGGISVDFNTNGRSSLGSGIGVGIQYYYKNKYGIFVYPQTTIHDLAIGLLERNISLGLAYRIDNY